MNQPNNQNHNQQRRYREGDLLPSEVRLRDFVAKQQLRAMKKVAGLAQHAAADTGRRNKDWRYNTGSADLNIIPDALVLEGRARQMVRDSWLAKSIVKAYKRNIAGRGIITTPHAKLPSGQPFVELNKVAQSEFTWWGRTKEACDVERKQTYGQMQRLAVSERATVGEHFWVWSYEPPLTADGRIDLTRPCGFRIQRFEPEQLDYRILSYQGREVRGGIELDENGAAVAYHFFTRNPADFLFRRAFWSRRIPRDRVWHYCEQERVLQTRGSTPMASVLQDMRDHARIREATLWRRIMEACIGIIFKKPFPTPAGSPLTYPFQQSDPNGQTNSGMRTADFVPGMAIEALPGEEVVPFTPTAQGSEFDAYDRSTVRGIGAGVGMSFGQIARQSDGNYSSARQDMLEDRKEWEPEQDLLIDDLLRACYETWFTFAALEGRFDVVPGFDLAEFMASRMRHVEAEYIPPPQTWIDPEKEANAYAILLKNNLITREEIIAMRGERFFNVIKKIAAEQKFIEEAGLILPEKADERADIRDVIKSMLKQATVAGEAAEWIDVPKTLDQLGVSVLKKPEPIKPLPAPANSGNSEANGAQLRRTRLSQLDAPNYRPCDNPVEKCATCSFLEGQHCRIFDFDVNLNNVCNAWSAAPINQGDQSKKSFPPGPMPGEKGIDRDFQPAADETPTA
jgi:lambda family phage portal protein